MAKANRAPVARLTGPIAAVVGESVRVDASGTTDSDGVVRKWALDWGDGDTARFTGNPGHASHVYSAPNVYDIVLSVQDNRKAWSSAKLTVTVRAAEPVPVPEPEPIPEPVSEPVPEPPDEPDPEDPVGEDPPTDPPPLPPPPPPPSDNPANAFFDKLAQSPNLLAAYSLRDPAQLATRANGGYAKTNDRDPAVIYDREFDAGRVVIPAGTVSLQNQLRLPINHGSNAFLAVWDYRWGPGWLFDQAGIQDYKTFQFDSPRGRIWTEIKDRFQRARHRPGSVSMLDVRAYAGSAEQYASGDFNGVNYGSSSLAPRLAEFAAVPETWNRAYALFVPRNDGTPFWDFTLAIGDETRDPVVLFDRAGVTPNVGEGQTGWSDFWLEFNTSSKPGQYLDAAGNPINHSGLYAHVRNVAFIGGVTSLDGLLERPVR